MKVINEITQEDILALEQFEKDRQRLHLPPVPVTRIKMMVHDKDGNGILEYNFRSKSWTRNAYNLLAIQMMCFDMNEGGTTFGAGKMPCKDTSGNTQQAAYSQCTPGDGTTSAVSNNSLEGAIGSAARGIVIGTGTGAEDFESYILGTLIAHGTGSGQMSYAAATATALSYDSGTKKVTSTLARIFNNNSGGSIVVAECGIYGSYGRVGSSNWFYLMCRDLLGATVTVPNAGQLTVTYTIDLTYPA